MSDKKLEDMGVFEQARWYALMEAINIIGDTCDERGINFEKIKMSPLDLQKYIEGTCDIFARKIEEEQKENHLKSIHISLCNLIPSLQVV